MEIPEEKAAKVEHGPYNNHPNKNGLNHALKLNNLLFYNEPGARIFRPVRSLMNTLITIHYLETFEFSRIRAFRIVVLLLKDYA